MVAAIALAITACDQSRGPEAVDVPATPEARGRTWFNAYCVPCHGASARGDGERAAELSQTPADLTRIAARNGWIFIPDAVAAYIDGREEVEAHGPSDMPVWGRTLDDRSAALGEEMKLSEPMIADIVAYLRTLQRD